MGKSLKLLYTRYIWYKAGQDSEKVPSEHPQIHEPRRWMLRFSSGIEFRSESSITNLVCLLWQRFRWKRKKDQVKGEEKRSIFNVPDKWGKRGKRQKERSHLAFYLTFNIGFLPQIKCWHCFYVFTGVKGCCLLLKSLLQLPNQTVMTAKKRRSRPNPRRNPEPALRQCSKHQGKKTKKRRPRRKAGSQTSLCCGSVTGTCLTSAERFRKGRREWGLYIRERRQSKKEKRQREEEKSMDKPHCCTTIILF